MKKLFTLISVALATMSVNAQEVWKAAEYDLTQATEQTLTEGIYAAGTADAPDTSVPGSLITSVITASTENVTMTGLSTPNSLSPWDIEDGKTQVYWELKGKPADDSNPNDALITDACNPKFAQYLMPKGNPEATHWEFVEETENGQSFRVYGTYWNPGDNMPAKGAYWKFDTKAAGTLKLGVYVNKGNHLFYVVDAATKQPLAPASINVAIYYQNTGFAYESQKDETTGEVIPGTEKYLNEGVMADDYILQHTNGCTQNRPALGYVSFPVEAGKTYYVFCQKSQIGLYGFEFTAGAGGGDVIEGEKVMLFFPEGAEAANEITFPGDYKIAITGNPDKTISGGNSITIDGTQYKSMKVSNGAENTLTLPSGLFATKLTFYSYVNKDAQTDRPAFWKEVGGVSYDITTSGGELMSFKDGENPDVRTYTLEKPMNTVTFTNTGEQLCYVLVVNVIDEATGIENVEVVTPANNAIYNLSGQKVDASYKGIIIVNGKKYFNK